MYSCKVLLNAFKDMEMPLQTDKFGGLSFKCVLNFGVCRVCVFGFLQGVSENLKSGKLSIFNMSIIILSIDI